MCGNAICGRVFELSRVDLSGLVVREAGQPDETNSAPDPRRCFAAPIGRPASEFSRRPAIQCVAAQSGTGRAAAVRVADSALAFTGQVVAPRLGGDVRTEAEAAWDVFGPVLARRASAAESVVRQGGEMADEPAVKAVESAVAVRFTAGPVAAVMPADGNVFIPGQAE